MFNFFQLSVAAYIIYAQRNWRVDEIVYDNENQNMMPSNEDNALFDNRKKMTQLNYRLRERRLGRCACPWYFFCYLYPTA